MEWVETTARTIEEAKELALDRLGVAEDEAEFEIVEEPRPGLFGRVRGEARVRARVRPAHPRPKVERRDRRRRGGATGGGDVAAPERAAPPTSSGRRRKEKPVTESEAEEPTREEGELALTFLEGLARAFGVQAQATTCDADDGAIEVSLEGEDLGVMIGPRGQTLLAIQDLTRLAAQRTEHATRLRIDIGGYREKRREALVRFTEQVANDVVASGTARRLEPMGAADRKVVHDAAGAIPGVTTMSEGEDPNRRVVITPSP